MKIGRNKKCPCGSGKKYKRCCLSKPTPEELERMFHSAEMVLNVDSEVLQTKGIYVNFVRPVNFQGKRVWALGSRLYPNEPPSITFSEFILRVLQQELGKEWWDENASRPTDEQHYIFRAYHQFDLWKKHSDGHALIGPDGSKGAYPDGWTYNLLSFAFDVAMLIHKSDKIDDDLIDRLRNRNEFQGARYEIAVASIFARAGCKITFIENHLNTEKHPEFYAEIPEENFKVAVEAKSRRRPGAIHETGELSMSNLRKTRIVPLINDALKQAPGNMPFIVFIDINQPPELSKSPQEHLMRLVKATSNLKKPTLENPDIFSIMYMTNYSGHFLQEMQMTKTYSTFLLPEFSLLPIRRKL
jgi:hypothetical protein